MHRCAERIALSAGVMPIYLSATTSDPVRSMYIWGDVGVGKTYRACAIALRAMGDGKSARVTTETDLLTRIRATYGTRESELDVLTAYRTSDVVVLDDLGKGRMTDFALSTLYDIIDHRYGHGRTTVVTSNYSLSGLGSKIAQCSDRETAMALVSRIRGLCGSPVHMSGGDRRYGD